MALGYKDIPDLRRDQRVTRGDIMLTTPLSDVRGWIDLYKSTVQTTGAVTVLTLIDYEMPEMNIGVIRAFGSGAIGGNTALVSINSQVDGIQFPKAMEFDGKDYSTRPGQTNTILVQLRSKSRITVIATIQAGFSGLVFGRVRGWYY